MVLIQVDEDFLKGSKRFCDNLKLVGGQSSQSRLGNPKIKWSPVLSAYEYLRWALRCVRVQFMVEHARLLRMRRYVQIAEDGIFCDLIDAGLQLQYSVQG